MKSALAQWIKQLENPKYADVVRERFGLSGEPKTLASIGRDFSITRERARQIETEALKRLAETTPPAEVRTTRANARRLITESHGFRAKESLEDQFKREGIAPTHLHLIVITDPAVGYQKQTPQLNEFYFLNELSVEQLLKLFSDIHAALHERVVPRDEFVEMLRDRARRYLDVAFHERNVDEFLRITREVAQNQFAEVGHVLHPRVQLKTLRWKIHLILEQSEQPMHFADIHGKLQELFDEDASSQSVHNELIRSPDFVLAGRGLFALKESGFDNRNVKDILVEYLHQKGPQDIEACIAHVLGKKLVKRETVLTTLYNSDYFKRVGEKLFDVKK